jgi:hypothetical protein
VEPFSNDPEWVKAEAALRLLPWIGVFDFACGRVVFFGALIWGLVGLVGLSVLHVALAAVSGFGAALLHGVPREVNRALAGSAFGLRRALNRALLGSGLLCVPGLSGVAIALSHRGTNTAPASLLPLTMLALVPPLALAAVNGLFLLVHGATFDELARLKQARDQPREFAAE